MTAPWPWTKVLRRIPKIKARNAQDSGLAQGGKDNVNVIVTDPALQFGHNNSYANGTGALAVSADAATTGAGSAMDNSNGGIGAMDQGVAQGPARST